VVGWKAPIYKHGEWGFRTLCQGPVFFVTGVFLVISKEFISFFAIFQDSTKPPPILRFSMKFLFDESTDACSDLVCGFVEVVVWSVESYGARL
jgi:hypothetical protein